MTVIWFLNESNGLHWCVSVTASTTGYFIPDGVFIKKLILYKDHDKSELALI